MEMDKQKNKMIAEFMGLVYDGGIRTPVEPYVSGQNIYAEDLKYHESWEWLMPVVKKMAEIYNEHPQKAYYDFGGMVDDLQVHLFQADIEEAFNLLAKFIEWYNENKKL